MKRAEMTVDEEEDAEANFFAVELLMPADWVRRDWAIEQRKTGKRGRRHIQNMARRYQVSEIMMTARLVSLGLPVPVE